MLFTATCKTNWNNPSVWSCCCFPMMDSGDTSTQLKWEEFFRPVLHLNDQKEMCSRSVTISSWNNCEIYEQTCSRLSLSRTLWMSLSYRTSWLLQPALITMHRGTLLLSALTSPLEGAATCELQLNTCQRAGAPGRLADVRLCMTAGDLPGLPWWGWNRAAVHLTGPALLYPCVLWWECQTIERQTDSYSGQIF